MFELGDRVRVARDARGGPRLVGGRHEEGTLARVDRAYALCYLVMVTRAYGVWCDAGMLERLEVGR